MSSVPYLANNFCRRYRLFAGLGSTPPAREKISLICYLSIRRLARKVAEGPTIDKRINYLGVYCFIVNNPFEWQKSLDFRPPL